MKKSFFPFNVRRLFNNEKNNCSIGLSSLDFATKGLGNTIHAIHQTGAFRLGSIDSSKDFYLLQDHKAGLAQDLAPSTATDP